MIAAEYRDKTIGNHTLDIESSAQAARRGFYISTCCMGAAPFRLRPLSMRPRSFRTLFTASAASLVKNTG